MHEVFPFYLILIVVIVFLIVLANKIKVAYPVLLVLAGLLISFIPAVPTLHIAPELIFTLFLPPLLYEAAWSISWKELWRWRRVVTGFAFGMVFFTAISVALVANYFIPGFSLALGFLLGGIVSPPDAVSAGAIMKFVKVPKRMSAVLEGESLLNDASSLIIFRFALIAVGTGQFFMGQALGSFAWMIVGGLAVGLAIGWVFMQLHRLITSDANVDIVLTLVAPYLMYILAEELESSGVIAVVSGGLYLSAKRYVFLNSYTRLRGLSVWESLIFVLNGLVFMLIGLDLPEIVQSLHAEAISLPIAIGYGVLITVVLIGSRFLFALLTMFITKIASRFITVADARNPGYKAPMVFGWTGMRGVVSLAAALSIPLQVSEGVDFPQRSLILFITFVVILSTLLVQGLTLPLLIKKIKLNDFDDHMPEEEAERYLDAGINAKAMEFLKKHEGQQLYTELEKITLHWIENSTRVKDHALLPLLKAHYQELLESQRNWLLAANSGNERLDEELVRKYLAKIDLEESRIMEV
ncbi:Na+/H+ antiporter [Sphingobacterium sp. Mn56C]|uniref:Na+/H+ antiporter n=1 Tax=Sphingobacterium sp. Mn56C TaxID=3395261 RepID=UPI003BBDDE0F